ncbi:MAG TPA: FliM/FliN family flagellar motor switch protein [Gemmatimonadaceae bacterium]|nr:FliM/FliN family flagellar motor switch protein [Gemmatimonadaceae bacterium]
MTKEALTQNQIDSLFRQGAATEPVVAPIAVAPRPARPDAQLYDFRRPSRVSKDKLRTLEAMYERLAKSLEGWLMGRVRGQADLRLQSVEQYSFGEFVLSLPMPCAAYTFEIAGCGGLQGVIDVGSDFAYFLVDRLFGGSGPPFIPQRPMTPIERMAVRTLAERAVHHLADIWRDHVELSFELSGFESIPEILRAANREDPVVVANIEVVAMERTSLLVICLPYTAIEKFFSSSTARRIVTPGNPTEQAANRELTEASLRASHVPLAVRLPVFRLPFRDLMTLAPGTVLATGIARTTALQVLVGSTPRFLGTAGRVNGRLGVQITSRMNVPESGEPFHGHESNLTPRP